MGKLFTPYRFCYVSNSMSKSSMLKSILDLLFFKKKKRLKQFHSLIARFFSIDPKKVFLYGAGRMGVYAVLKTLKLSNTDEVIVAGYTCVVLTNVVEFANCQIKYVDISPSTLNIDTESLLDSISEKTKVLIIPHNFGISYDDIDEIRSKYPSIIIIEDAAHSFGSTFSPSGELIGLKGDASFFSMEYSKPISTGLGGILIVNNDKILKEVEKSYKTTPHFSNKNTVKIFLTFLVMNISMWKRTNSIFIILMTILRKLKLQYATSDEEIYGKKPNEYPVKLSPSLSILGCYQLKNILNINQQKKEITKMYYEFFSQFESIKQFYSDNYIMVRYPILFPDDVKDSVIEKMRNESIKKGITLGDWFNDVVHPNGLYRYGYTSKQCLVGEMVSKKIINLPVNVNMKPTLNELESIKEIFIKNNIS